MRQSNNVKAVFYCRVANSFDAPYAIREQERQVYAYAKENGYTILVQDVSRLFRDYLLQTQFEQLCEKYGVALIAPALRKVGVRQ